MKAFFVTYKAYCSVTEHRTALVYAADEDEALEKVRRGEEEDIVDYETADSDTNEVSFDGADVCLAHDRDQTQMRERLIERGELVEDEGISWPTDKVKVDL